MEKGTNNTRISHDSCVPTTATTHSNHFTAANALFRFDSTGHEGWESTATKSQKARERQDVRRRFSVERSTEDHFKAECYSSSSDEEDKRKSNGDNNGERLTRETQDNRKNKRGTQEQKSQSQLKFYGAYGHLRKRLDYSYHKCYRKERQWLHDSIIDDFLHSHNHDHHHLKNGQEEVDINECSKVERSQGSELDPNSIQRPCSPWLIISVGAQGAGKIYSLNELVKSGYLPLLSLVCIDRDEIRRFLPEYTSYVENCHAQVDALTQKECGYIGETLLLATLQEGRNAIWDCALCDAHWYASYIRFLRQEFMNIQIGLIHVTAKRETILQRAQKRSATTGRAVPLEIIEKSLLTIPQSIAIVKPEVDCFFELENTRDDELPELLHNMTWNEFRRIFNQQSLNEASPAIPSSLTTDDILKAARNIKRDKSRRCFSVLESSEDNHRSNDRNFYGPYAHIRATLDYSYHANYTFERQRFQDAVIEEFVNAAIIFDVNGEVCTTPTEPWLVFTAGAMGAGKSYTMRKLVEKGRFPLLAFVRVDPDEIRRYLPEFHLYVKQSPELAGELTRKEAGFIAEILTLAGLQAGKNVLVDGSLRDSEWYKGYFARLRTEFPILRLAIIHVTAPRGAVFQRAAERALATGRIVPRELLVQSLEQVPQSVQQLAPLVDFHVELHNAPNAADIELATPGITWESFQSNWTQ